MKKGFYYRSAKGIYEYQFTFEGKRYSVYAGTMKECERKADQKKEDLKNRLHIDNKKITLDQYYSECWLPDQKKTLKRSTLYAYSKPWKHLEKHFGKKKLCKLQKADILTFEKEMLVDHSAKTVNNCIKLLRSILNSAVADRIILFNPADNIKKIKENKEKATDTNHKALTIEETETFLKASKGTYYHNLYRFLLNTGCRIGEALALTWADIDDKEIRISKTVSKISNKEFVIEDTPKTSAGVRTIPITENLLIILQDQRKQNLFMNHGQGRIFSNTKGNIASYNSINRSIESIIDKINNERLETNRTLHIVPDQFRRFTVHAFRDTFATRCAEQGMNPKVLQRLLGHSNINITMNLYVQVMEETKAEEMNKIRLAI